MTREFTPAQKAGILQREGGLCAMSGARITDGVILPRHNADTVNHRLNRGTGGTNATENGCAICHSCNGLIESDADYAAAARRRGVKLRTGDNPRTVALWCVFFAQWAQLIGDAMLLTGAVNSDTPPELTDTEQPELAL